MRRISDEAWAVIKAGFDGEAPIGDVETFWEWGSHQGSAFRLATTAVLALADAECDETRFPGFRKAEAELRRRHWRGVAHVWDQKRNLMMGQLIANFRRYFPW